MNIKKRARTDAIVVHCSATPPKANIGAVEIDQWHRKRGWICIGYHFVIRRDGSVELGRPHDTVGSHVQGHNSTTIGICLVGGVDAEGKAENNFTAAQFDSLSDLLRSLKKMYPAAEIKGHRDFPGVAKDCPSFDVKRWVKTSLTDI